MKAILKIQESGVTIFNSLLQRMDVISENCTCGIQLVPSVQRSTERTMLQSLLRSSNLCRRSYELE